MMSGFFQILLKFCKKKNESGLINLEDKLGQNALYMGCEAGHEHIVKVFYNFCVISPFVLKLFVTWQFNYNLWKQDYSRKLKLNLYIQQLLDAINQKKRAIQICKKQFVDRKEHDQRI